MKETLGYEAVQQIRNQIDSTANQMESELNEAKEIINLCESEGIFVTDQASKAMQETFAEFAKTFQPFIEKLREYSDFLTKNLNISYQQLDQNLSNIWNSVAEEISQINA